MVEPNGSPTTPDKDGDDVTKLKTINAIQMALQASPVSSSPGEQNSADGENFTVEADPFFLDQEGDRPARSNEETKDTEGTLTSQMAALDLDTSTTPQGKGKKKKKGRQAQSA